MNLFRSKKQQRTGIIIKDHVIRYVHAKKPSLNDINTYSERFLPEGIIRDGNIMEKETFLSILAECISDWKLKKNDVQYCVPDSSIVIRTINVPRTVDRKNLAGYLFMEIGESIHLPFEDPVFDFKVIGEDEEQFEILIIAGRGKIVNDFREAFIHVKLNPNAADVLPLSIYRLLYELKMINTEEHALIVQNDITNLNLTVFHQHYPLFSRYFPPNVELEKFTLGNDNGQERLVWGGESSQIEVQADNLYREIDRVMNFYRFSFQKGKTGISKIIIVGDHPELERMIEYCRKRIEIPISDLIQMEHSEGGVSFPHYYYDVMGLMLKKEVL